MAGVVSSSISPIKILRQGVGQTERGSSAMTVKEESGVSKVWQGNLRGTWCSRHARESLDRFPLYRQAGPVKTLHRECGRP